MDDLEKDKENAALLSGQEYTRLIEPGYQWTTWATQKLADGKIDHNAQTGDDLLDFVNSELFPYLKKFKGKHIYFGQPGFESWKEVIDYL
ncbi:MAG: hypothetical protein JEZ09_20690 [Salinivirgaceae bacterium]|nr:hypothetical protein [Salinivirgaceae bacterium]